MEHFLHKSYNFFLKGFKSVLFVVVFCLMGVMGMGQNISIPSLPFNPAITNFNSYNPSSAINLTSTIPSGWTATSTGTSVYNGQGNGTSSTGGYWSFGNGSDYSLGALRSITAGNISYAVSYINNSGSIISSITLAWDYKQWRYANASGWDCSGTGQLSGNATLNAKDFIGSATGTDGTATTSSISTFTLTGLNISNGQSFGLIWITTDPTGSDNGISIDNFTISASSGVVPVSSPSDYFRSKQSGDWGVNSTWESSTDGITWINATLFPTSAAKTITIQSSHIVTITSNSSADQVIINNGGLLNYSGGTFTLNDGTGDDLNIENGGIFTLSKSNSTPTFGPGSPTINVSTGGVLRISAGGLTDPGAGVNANNFVYQHQSILEWTLGTGFAFSTGNVTYFPNVNSSTIPIFRTTNPTPISVGGGNPTIINGIFECNSSVFWQNGGPKTFRDGIIGTGTLTQDASSGVFIINGNNAILGGSGSINLNTNGLQIAGSARVDLISNKTINGSGNDFTISYGGQLNCSTFVVSGTCDFVLADGGTLGIGSPEGIISSSSEFKGNIQTFTRYYSSGGNYLYNGTTAQSTGDFTTSPSANTVNTLTIANTGAPTNVTTLTKNNLTVSNLYLSSGLFAAGDGQNLNIASGGAIYGNGGHNIEDISAGNIVFLGPGTTYGNAPNNPRLYSVIIGNGGVIGVDFKGGPSTNSAAQIMKSLQINGGGFVTNAPYYKTGFSSLIYNIDFNVYGAYKRNVEWGNTVGLQGYPHHVIVQGNTILDLNTNSISASQLATGGDLIIGNASGWGKVYMNNSMSKALSVGGNLTIGSVAAASNSSELWLSNTMGGDLWLNGNFTRYNNSFYTDNNRAIFFKGGVANVTINTPDISTPGVPSQYFSYVLLEKDAGTETITLNCAVGINNAITFTKGIIKSSTNNLLVVSNAATSTVGSTSSFVHGPMKKIGNQDFIFPVGKIVGSEYHHRIIGISSISNTTDAFTAEFRRESATALGPINSPGSPPLQWVSRCEYWTLDRTAGTSNVNVTLSWSSQSACNLTYVTDVPTLVVAHFDNVSKTWNKHGANFRDGDNNNGIITWYAVTDYSPFSLGTIDVRQNYLPFTLSNFTARSRKSDIQIDWNVMNNIDQDEYILEHSKDGIQFTTLKVVKAKVILNQAAYTELDQTPYNGWNYYRLRAKDKLDREKVSQVVKVWFGFADVIRISPNPASEKININLAEPSSINQIQVVNATGQVLKQVNNIQFNNEINISELAAGIYYLRLTGKNGLAIKSFVKN